MIELKRDVEAEVRYFGTESQMVTLYEVVDGDKTQDRRKIPQFHFVPASGGVLRGWGCDSKGVWFPFEVYMEDISIIS